MGRDVTGLRMNKKSNAKLNGVTRDRVCVSPNISNGETEQEKVVGNHDSEETVNEGSQEKQDVLTVKSTNAKAGFPGGGKTKAESLKPNEKKLSSPAKMSPEIDAKSSELSTENSVPSMSIANKVEITDAAISPSKMNEMHTPVTARRSQPHSLLKYQDEEDTLSLASSVATSVRTVRSKVTVPMGPTFKSAERLARRREFYTKLEEKHKALEAEKLEYTARSKEEKEAAMKQLRKSMTYRANPVPNFYREGPPPRTELKKLPVTRAKSPNFTRRKSYGDAVKSYPDENKSAPRPTRHSIGVYKNGIASPTTPKSKDLSTTRNVKGPSKLKDSNGSSKTKSRSKQVKETAITPHSESEHMSPDMPLVVETITSHVKGPSPPDPAVVEDEMKNAATEIIEDSNMNSLKAIEA